MKVIQNLLGPVTSPQAHHEIVASHHAIADDLGRAMTEHEMGIGRVRRGQHAGAGAKA